MANAEVTVKLVLDLRDDTNLTDAVNYLKDEFGPGTDIEGEVDGMDVSFEVREFEWVD